MVYIKRLPLTCCNKLKSPKIITVKRNRNEIHTNVSQNKFQIDFLDFFGFWLASARRRILEMQPAAASCMMGSPSPTSGSSFWNRKDTSTWLMHRRSIFKHANNVVVTKYHLLRASTLINSNTAHNRSEPRPQGICTENFTKIGQTVPEICSRTDRHSYRQTDCNTPLPYWGGVTRKQYWTTSGQFDAVHIISTTFVFPAYVT